MCSRCCALGVVGILVYCVQQVVFATFVANRLFGRLGVEGKIILRRVLNRNDSHFFFFQFFKMIFQTILKMIIDLRIYHKTDNY
jgi:hypothetical protein